MCVRLPEVAGFGWALCTACSGCLAAKLACSSHYGGPLQTTALEVGQPARQDTFRTGGLRRRAGAARARRRRGRGRHVAARARRQRHQRQLPGRRQPARAVPGAPGVPGLQDPNPYPNSSAADWPAVRGSAAAMSACSGCGLLRGATRCMASGAIAPRSARPARAQGSACVFPAFKEVFEELGGAGEAAGQRRLFRNTGGGMQWCGPSVSGARGSASEAVRTRAFVRGAARCYRYIHAKIAATPAGTLRPAQTPGRCARAGPPSHRLACAPTSPLARFGFPPECLLSFAAKLLQQRL